MKPRGQMRRVREKPEIQLVGDQLGINVFDEVGENEPERNRVIGNDPSNRDEYEAL